MAYLGARASQSDAIPMDIPVTTRTRWTSTATPTTRTAIRTPTAQLPEAPVPRQPLPQDCPPNFTWSHRTNSCIPYTDPNIARREECARTGGTWMPGQAQCYQPKSERIKTPEDLAKEACISAGKSWNSVSHTCTAPVTERDPLLRPQIAPRVTGPTIAVPPPPTFDAASDSKRRADLCRSRGGTPTAVGSRSQGCDMPTAIPVLPDQKPNGVAVDMMHQRYEPTQQPYMPGTAAPVSVSVTAPGEGKMPGWLIPALIAGATFLM